MAESAQSLYRRGMISRRQASKLGLAKDEGSGRVKGISDTDGDAINRNQKAGSVIAGKPSKQGGVNASQQPKTDEIDQGEFQRPAFPKAETPKKSNNGPPRRGRVQPSGPLYGGPNSRADG